MSSLLLPICDKNLLKQCSEVRWPSNIFPYAVMYFLFTHVVREINLKCIKGKGIRKLISKRSKYRN